jgi:hypothetical protein
MSVAAVKNVAGAAIHQVLQAENMCINQIHNMNIIPDAGTVRRRIIGAVDADMLPFSRSCFENKGNEVGLGVMAFADPGERVSTCGIEIPEGYKSEVFREGLREAVSGIGTWSGFP